MWIDDIFEGKEGSRKWTFIAYITVAPAALYWLIYRPTKAIISGLFSLIAKLAPDNKDRGDDLPPPYGAHEDDGSEDEEKYSELQLSRKTDFTSTVASAATTIAPNFVSPYYVITSFLICRKHVPGLTDAAVFPWGYGDITNFAEGTIITIDSKKHLAWFTNDLLIQQVQNKYKVTFEFHLSEEKEVNLKGVVPDGTTAFQYMSQAYFEFQPPLTAVERASKTSKIMQALDAGALGKNPAAQQRLSLLKCGGFFYHAGPWQQDRYTSHRTRSIAGIRVFLPRNDKSQKTYLYFGQAKLLTPQAIAVLKGKCNANSIATEEAILNPITVPSLLDQGMSHYRWLAPGDPAILAMQQLHGPSFGRYGVFLYRSQANHKLDCMLPVTDQEESAKHIQKYQQAASSRTLITVSP
ncbi:MAG: hypothetical protein K0S27_578 [Gammaproteobacteria bacterium]|jgi:hypothetical protein|nr:hypothetical protein [Gammaproteobacteria bacterium]